MYYTIMYAKSCTNPSTYIDFDKSGNKFVVRIGCRNDEGQWTISRSEFTRYDDAESKFRALCDEFDMDTVITAEPDFDATDFD